MTAPQIPFNIANALVYPVSAQINALPSSLSTPPPENFKYIALQFTYTQSLIWFLNLSGTINPASFSAIRALYVDNTQAIYDVKIVSPGTNCMVTVPSGSSGYYPILTIPGDLSLYVASTAKVSNSDITNVYILNSYVPPSDYPEYQKVLQYGLNGSTAQNIVPIYTANSTLYSGVVNCAVNLGTPVSYTLFSYTNWYITNLTVVSFGVTTTLPNLDGVLLLQIYETGTTNYIVNRYLGPYNLYPSTPVNEISLQGINYISDGLNGLSATLSCTSTDGRALNITAGTLQILAIGGRT